MNNTDKILILDFGSQTTALIWRRIREMGAEAEVIAGDAPLDEAALAGVKGIILGGSPESVYAGGPEPDKRVYECGLPLLGICYGIQRMTADLGGKVEPLPQREYGGVEVRTGLKSPRNVRKPNWEAIAFLTGFLTREDATLTQVLLGRKCVSSFNSWMSHGDSITALAPGFVEAGTSASGCPAILCHAEKPWFGVQFHPEVSHCERGSLVLSSFVFGVCRCAKNWSIEKYVEETAASLRHTAAGKRVLLLISGGVDSTVAAALLLKALGADGVHLMYMDTGLMRKDETAEVTRTLESLGAKHIHIVHCADEFFDALAGLEAPEDKRRTIGDLFISIQEREVERLNLPPDYFLAQGTLYTDLIESGKGVGAKAHLIKSHHNVGSPLVAAKREAGRILEPLDRLYKDEVRALGRLLGLSEDVVGRHPFPGPGLAVRIPGEVTRAKCAVLREADAIFIDELKQRRNPATGRRLYDEIWQAFAVLLPVRSVGVAGDLRKYGWVVALRAVASADGMTADVYPFNAQDILEIAALITNNVPEAGRVTLDISSKPPATIEWE